MTDIARKPGWRGALTHYVIATARDPFAWGKSDCAIWAAGAIEAMTGTDIARGFRGYRSWAGGVRKARAKGFEDHVAYFASLFPEIPPSMAQIGDVACVPADGDTLAIGIVQGEGIYVPMPEGRGIVPLTSAIRAFRV